MSKNIKFNLELKDFSHGLHNDWFSEDHTVVTLEFTPQAVNTLAQAEYTVAESGDLEGVGDFDCVVIHESQFKATLGKRIQGYGLRVCEIYVYQDGLMLQIRNVDPTRPRMVCTINNEELEDAITDALGELY